MSFVMLADGLTSNRVPHEKCVIGKSVYYFAKLPAGDYYIHESNHWKEGYGGDAVDFLMADGSIETVVGPWERNGVMSNKECDMIAERLNRPEIAVRATRLVIGRNLFTFSKHPRIVHFEEPEFVLGDWRQRLREEWIGWECEVKVRGGSSFRDVGKILDELRAA